MCSSSSLFLPLALLLAVILRPGYGSGYSYYGGKGNCKTKPPTTPSPSTTTTAVPSTTTTAVPSTTTTTVPSTTAAGNCPPGSIAFTVADDKEYVWCNIIGML